MKTSKSTPSKKSYHSVKYKTSIILELLRGEPAEVLARREGLSLSKLSDWESIFLESGSSGFKTGQSKESSDLKRARHLIADQAMELALYKKKLSLLNITVEK